ncbi:hypothetical protein GCM10019016_062740 [Streptomyces prasinosporus]|uniref:Bacterial bifunctional deaminase-reductase C-terminal domain-containing protein n=1 Tax=Streptomyces prasinosporus TaxID=68256 RepID=A0ABP6TWE7_9ACTN
MFSRRRLDLRWRNSEQAQGDVAEVAAALKSEPARDIALSGSVSVVRQLLAAGLARRTAASSSTRSPCAGACALFDEGEPSIPLKLLRSETFGTGVLNLVYGPDTRRRRAVTRRPPPRSEA